MEQQDNQNKTPKTHKLPSKTEMQLKQFEEAFKNKDVQKLIKMGYGVFVNSDTGEISILEDRPKDNKQK